MSKKNCNVVVMCRNAEGAPDFHTCGCAVTQEEYDEGMHYDMAMKNATDNGFENVCMAFDASDSAAQQMRQIAQFICPSDDIAVPRHILAALLDMAKEHVEDIESGIEDGTYLASENEGLAANKQATLAADALYRDFVFSDHS